MAPGVKKHYRRTKTPLPTETFVDRWFTRRNAILGWVFGLLCFVGILLFPLSSGFTRLAGAILAAELPLGLLLLGWHFLYFRWTLIALLAAASLFMVLPGRLGYDRLALRQETVHALVRYEGARYSWGGENRFGIDCSGLVRRGAIAALFLQGLRTVNPVLVRKAVAIWWHDTSARELGAGAGGKAERLYEVKAIAGMDDSRLHPGDFAIIQNGIHALAYLGDHLWLEADPGENKVVRVNPRTTESHWFHTPVLLVRWRHLEIPQMVGRRRGMQ